MRRVELVVWLDSWQERAGWHDITELARDIDLAPRQRTVGFVIGESKRSLLIASNVSGSGRLASAVTAIPKAAILERRRVKPR